MKKKVSSVWVKRLSRMYTVINYLLKSEDEKKFYISKELGALLNIHADVVRKDLNQFGELGTAHRGYSLSFLAKTFLKELKLSRIHTSCIVGLGKFGGLLLSYDGFERSNCRIVAGFDSDPTVFNDLKTSIPLYSLQEMRSVIKEKNIHIAILTVPENSCQKVAELLIESGIKAIVNYTAAPVIIPAGCGVTLIQIDLVHILTYLASRINLEENHVSVIDG